jgi:hypothetical protein
MNWTLVSNLASAGTKTYSNYNEDLNMVSLRAIQSSLVDYFRTMVQEKVHELVEPLSSEQIWQRLFPYGNSIGNLIMHVTGNLNYYMGPQIAGTGYIRHRDLEFNASGQSKDDILKAFDESYRYGRPRRLHAIRR